MSNSQDFFDFFTEDLDFQLQYESELSTWLGDIAQNEKKALSKIEYIFCSDNYLLEINKTHLNHDYYTDIITFPLNQDPIEATIFISIDRVKDNAISFKQKFEDELHRVIAHGLLHLIGYNDKTDEESQKMRAMENQVLTQRSFLKLP